MHDRTQPAHIALQLYTVRAQIAENIQETLMKISGIGFKDVETGFWPEGMSIEQAAKYLQSAGLRVISAHCEIPVGNKKSEFLKIAESYQCKRLVWHGWPEDIRYKHKDGIKALADIYNESAAFAKRNNVQFGIHNHWWEFHNKLGERFAYEILLENLDPEVFFELDTYWLKASGHDPADIVAHFADRAPLLHIKDGLARFTDDLTTDTTPMVAVGSGSLDFHAIVKAANGNTQWMIVEMDRVETNVFDALQQSYLYLIDNGLAA